MPSKTERIALELLGLPAATRADLACRLIASLDEDEDPDAEHLWLDEAIKRAQEIDEGKVKTIPARAAIRKARKSLKR